MNNSAGGVDYVSAPVSIQFNQTDDRRCFYITIIDDFNRETAETFEVALLANTGVTIVDPSLATVTIIDDDTNRKFNGLKGSPVHKGLPQHIAMHLAIIMMSTWQLPSACVGDCLGSC